MNGLKSKESERTNVSLLNSLRILEYLGSVDHPASLAELVRALVLHKSRVMRLCGTLESMNYLKYDEEKEVYSLGSRLMTLGRIYERQTPVISEIRSVLAEIVAELKETAGFYVLIDERRVCLCSVESPHPIRFIMNEGAELRYPYGSIWKVIMSWGPAELKEKILAGAPYVPVTPYTIVTRQDLEKTIETTLKQGYCHTRADHDVGSSAVSVPILEPSGKFIGVLSVGGVTERMDSAFMVRAVPLLRQKAAALSLRLMGWAP
ncbi:MAG: IclR family transcriptional regulator [Synergistaceae bacterium]|nr:IclR family transcriptional regulator [Synergistaceae bacterium]